MHSRGSRLVLVSLLPLMTAAAEWEPVDMGEPPDRYSHPTPRAINDHGQVIGELMADDYWERVFLWEDGRWTILPTLGGRWAYTGSINERGQIVGVAETDEMDQCWEWGEGEEYCDYFTRAFLWEGASSRTSGSPRPTAALRR